MKSLKNSQKLCQRPLITEIIKEDYTDYRRKPYLCNLTFISTMQKLGSINLANSSPGVFIELWLYDHPPIAKRIKLAEEIKL